MRPSRERGSFIKLLMEIDPNWAKSLFLKQNETGVTNFRFNRKSQLIQFGKTKTKGLIE